MSTIYNFSAGPAVIFKPVLAKMQQELTNYKNSGYSLLEASHRGALYKPVHERAVSLFKEILELSDDYEVLFLGGGATLQFSMLPFNFLPKDASAHYIISGAWGKKAAADATVLQNSAGTGACTITNVKTPRGYTTVPSSAIHTIPEHSAYVHITGNETIDGVQWNYDPTPECGTPVVADMSSEILSRPINSRAYSMIYAGAQKNIGPAGVTIVILRKQFLEIARDDLPAYLSYKTHAEKQSLYNTPPVFAVWAVSLVLQHIADMGGLPAMQKHNDEKAAALYGAIDESGGFYNCPVEPQYRSNMNVVFHLPSTDLDAHFADEANNQGMVGLKGHRSVGGCRASLYNAMPCKGVEALTAFMKDFQTRNG